MSALSASDGMMNIATTEAMAAGLVLAPAIMVNFEFKASTGKATDLEKAGIEWQNAAGLVQKTAEDLQQSVASIGGQDWTADDRKGYEAKVQEFCSQLQVLYVFCMAVGIALTVIAYALFAYAIFALAMGSFLGVLAIAAAAALASVVGAPAYPELLAIAATCLTVTHVATAILAGVGQLGAATMAGGSMVAAIAETVKGNDKALGDFMQAQATGAAGALANLGQNAANAGLNYVNRTGGVNIEGGGKGTPLKAVDLDADRNFDSTWNVGAGATVEGPGGGTAVVGAHAKYGDRGWMGVEGEGKYTTASGVTGGGKVGWEEDAKGNDSVYGGINGGYEKNGYGATGGVDGRYGVDDGSWSVKENHGATYQTGNVYNSTNGVAVDGDGKTTWSDKTESVLGNSKSESEAPPWDR
ncbi:hypothetical protein [Actinomadura xylanilytica]|uniref:hypothetical protein n=1 Tax=Actinomadura xylanilytica TaxID=887459 RepID=UPI00255AEDB1|nr:hypothetical protein [Actinomadura xylanilytica]MDL4772867.1 hypothetical protein [Actinomadura xylanilytica]